MINGDSHPYRITPNIAIVREGLMHIFDSLSDERIIYIGAPAGSGKTVAVRQWLGRSASAKAIVSLDEYDNDPMSFCVRFCAALRLCQPQNAELAKIVSHPAFLNAPDEFTVRAIASLTKRKGTILVIDDLHFIQDGRVLRLMLILIKRLPANFRIVLVSRNNPPAGFSDLWLSGSLARITAEHFRFSIDEITALYKKRGSPITPEQAGDIYKFTEGWAIGVNALCLSGGEPAGEIKDYLDDFIRDNIWERWEEDTREFMLMTAIARELTPQFCAALTGMADCEDILSLLVAQNAFITGTSGGAYKYHQLFRDFLLRMMKGRGDEFIRRQWERAGDWHLSQSSFYDAVECFIKCDNHDGIARGFGLLVNAGHEYLYIDKLLTVAHESTIEKVAEAYPYIYSTLMWAAFNEGRERDMARYAGLYYKNQHAITRLDPRLQLNIILVWLVDFRIPISELLRMSENLLGGSASAGLSEMGVSLGTINQNMPLLHRGTRDFSELAVGSAEANIEIARAALGRLFGEGSVLLAECLAAGLAYEQGQLEKAHRHAVAANAAIGAGSSPETKFFAMSIMIYVLDALGERKQAERVIKRISDMIESSGAYYLNPNFNALVTRLRLGGGDADAAREWLGAHGAQTSDDPHFYVIYEIFTTCRAYIAAGDYDPAIILLTKLLRLANTYGRPLDMIETQILLAISYWKKKRGFQQEAMRFLEDAVLAAYSFGYTQMFINEGADLAGMTLKLQRSMEQRRDTARVPVSYVKMLYLKMLDSQSPGLTSGQQEPPVKYSQKQRLVMRHLCDGKSYREIAEAMGIKLPTLRSHIALIYKKLGVTTSADAIKKISAQGLALAGGNAEQEAGV